MAEFEVVPQRMALVNVDMQNWFVGRASEGLSLLERINKLSAACREAGILVIHTSHVLRPDGSNIGILKEMVPMVSKDGILNKGAETSRLHPALHIDPGDILLEKPRFGAFHGTDLEIILRSRGIDSIIISGISTDVCCDTTAREANARDFCVFLLSDGTAVATSDVDMAAKSQQATFDALDGLFAHVITISQLLELISQTGSK
jgi:nicotinamidase-related amidase